VAGKAYGNWYLRMGFYLLAETAIVKPYIKQ